MDPLHLTFLLASITCFLVAAWQHSSPTWNRLACIGAALAVASLVNW